jgi:hypothetical protein
VNIVMLQRVRECRSFPIVTSVRGTSHSVVRQLDEGSQIRDLRWAALRKKMRDLLTCSLSQDLRQID